MLKPVKNRFIAKAIVKKIKAVSIPNSSFGSDYSYGSMEGDDPQVKDAFLYKNQKDIDEKKKKGKVVKYRDGGVVKEMRIKKGSDKLVFNYLRQFIKKWKKDAVKGKIEKTVDFGDYSFGISKPIDVINDMITMSFSTEFESSDFIPNIPLES